MKIRTLALVIFSICLVQSVMVQSQQPTPTPPGPQASMASSGNGGDCGEPDPNAIHQYVSYFDQAPLCSEPTITVQTFTNPFSEPCFVFIDFQVDDDIMIDGQMYQSPGTDFSFHDGVCPDANGAHSDHYCRTMDVGEQITLGVKNNFRGQIYLYADVYFSNADEPSDTNTKPNDEKRGGDEGDCSGMARYSAHALLASLNIQDTPLRYSPPRGPAIDFIVTYNQRDAQQPETFAYSNLGPKWTFNWLSYVTDNPNYPYANAAVYVPSGGAERYFGFNPVSHSYLPDPQSHAVLVRTSSAAYEKRFADGSKQIFDLSDGGTSPRKIFMTQIVDPAGNAVVIGYDESFRIITLTALDQVTTISYDDNDPLKITKVTDPFGRFAMFHYTNGQLDRITDPVGIQSQFSYQSDTDFINSITTPYGTSQFTTGVNGTNRWLEMTDPRGGIERVEYKDGAVGASEPVAPPGFTNSALDVANTFYWDKKYTELYPPTNYPYDYTKARIIHWAKNPDGSVSGIPASEKTPLENRVWYAYAGQADTNHTGGSASRTQVARVLDDGTTKLWQYQYNDFGHVTQSIDPIGRVMSYDYDTNNIDLLDVRQTTGSNNELLRSLTYTSFHEPLTDTDAAGQTTTYSYNSFGQVLSVENARHETTTYAYGDGTNVPNGYLASITGPDFNGAHAITSFTYDSANRVRTVTNSPDDSSTTTDYDNLDRPTQIVYSDGTAQQFQYTDDNGRMMLDWISSFDCTLNLETRRHYNANRQMDSITDLAGRTTFYDWCTCGALTGITDPNGNVTTFNRDLQSRVTSKVFADQSAISYTYEDTTSRLKSMLDANGQTTHYQYYVDDDLQQVSYTNPLSPTPTVTFSYDPNYNRVTSMTDGIGPTNYTYYPITLPPVRGAGKLKDVDGPFSNDTLTYTYDELGRTVGQSINGVSSSVAFDSLGRLNTSDNTLGHFDRTYDDVTQRLQRLTYPNGVTADYSYFDNSFGRRLQTLRNSTDNGTTTLSQFDYMHVRGEPEIQTLTKDLNNGDIQTESFEYDDAGELTSATTGLDEGFYYSFDNAGNRYGISVGNGYPPCTHFRGRVTR